MTEITYLFPNPLWSLEVDFDNESLARDIYNFKENNPSQIYSNVGGYQGDLFEHQAWAEMIAHNCPQRNDKPLTDLNIYPWVNVNPKGSYNRRHVHMDTSIFLSGVYYVKVPENSGNIRFYDPRGPLMHVQRDHEYFSDSIVYHEVKPYAGLLLYFPTWFEHDVTENETDEDRISIAFNVFADTSSERDTV